MLIKIDTLSRLALEVAAIWLARVGRAGVEAQKAGVEPKEHLDGWRASRDSSRIHLAATFASINLLPLLN